MVKAKGTSDTRDEVYHTTETMDVRFCFPLAPGALLLYSYKVRIARETPCHLLSPSSCSCVSDQHLQCMNHIKIVRMG